MNHDSQPYLHEEGNPAPLGTQQIGKYTNFSLFSAHAEKVVVCFFRNLSEPEYCQVELKHKTGDVWHGLLGNVLEGTMYAYRVYGMWSPENGHRFNGNKILMDPYAMRIAGEITMRDEIFGYQKNSPYEDLSFDNRDSSPYMPRCLVHNPVFRSTESSPLIPWSRTIIYEAHVKGLTMNNFKIPDELRGKFSGFACLEVIEYIKKLGVTSVELLPTSFFLDEERLQLKGLKNYWGYNSLNFFIPHNKYCLENGFSEFSELADKLHSQGLELLLDMVYNHTSETDHLGPHLSYRGIDNLSYYELDPSNRRFYVNAAGCGNTLNTSHPVVRQLILDSLRHWVQLGADGFRFDLAPILARENGCFLPDSDFFSEINQCPILSSKKMIAEPWDCSGEGGIKGTFPTRWAEWNDSFRDSTRKFFLGIDNSLRPFAHSLTGDCDKFPIESEAEKFPVNFIASHDGFTLRDCVTYESKHNLANGENNQDGDNHVYSKNFGVEGETEENKVTKLRVRSAKNMLLACFLSQGVPMLLAGDEFGNTQSGNNNAYCQDNSTGWIDKKEDKPFSGLTEFISGLAKFRQEHSLFFQKKSPRQPYRQFEWLSPAGKKMTIEEWENPANKTFAMVCHFGSTISGKFYYAVNMEWNVARFELPDNHGSDGWKVLFNTSGVPSPFSQSSEESLLLPPLSSLLLYSKSVHN